MNKKMLSTMVLFLVGFLLFVGIFYSIGISEIISQIKNINILYFSISFLFVFSTIIFWSLRWRTFINIGYKVPLTDVIKILLVGISANNLTPMAKFGGEPLRAYLLRKIDNVPIETSLATILSDLTIEFIVSIVFVIISTLLLFFKINPPIWISIILIIFLLLSFLGICGMIGIYSGKKFINKIILWLGRRSRRIKKREVKILSKYEEFQIIFKKIMKNKRIFSESVLWSILMKASDILKFVFIFLSLGYKIDLITIIIIIGIGIMLRSIPATPGALGILEGGWISAFVIMSIPIEIAASVVFLERLLWFWFLTATGGIIGTKYSISILNQKNLKDK